MNACKLIFRSVRRHIRDYLLYFLTLTLCISLFYAFNALSDQPAFVQLDSTRALLYEQLGIAISTLSVVIAAVLAFLIVYANGFLLRRRKRELGIYMLSGMKQGRLACMFAAEALLVGLWALGLGLALGVALSQGLSLIALRLFAVELSEFAFVLSPGALNRTLLCFAVIFLLVTLLNIRSVARVRLIDLFTAERRNEAAGQLDGPLPRLLFPLALCLIAGAFFLFSRHGILPSRDNHAFETACFCLLAGTLLFFQSVPAVLISLVRAQPSLYLRGLGAFLVRQIASRLRTNCLAMSAVCGLLTVTLCAVCVGVSTAMAMNALSQSSTPYDLNVISDVDMDGDTDIAQFLSTQGIDMADYAQEMEQISLYEADFTYSDLFAGQDLRLWSFDSALPTLPVSVISVTDFNRALAIQGRPAIALEEGTFRINCNYEGTLAYVEAALAANDMLTVAGIPLRRACEETLHETYYMTSVGNNDRGTLIVPDAIAARLTKDVNVLLVQYKPQTDTDHVLAQMIPIGLDDAHGYRYTEKNMMYGMYYGVNAFMSFLCCYVGVVFLLVCAALLAAKQLTDLADSAPRYALLQKLGAGRRQIRRALLAQTSVFFAAPLAVACLFSSFLIRELLALVEEFMHLHISTHVLFTAGLLLFLYGGYFLAAYLSCRRMIEEQMTPPGRA